MVNRGEEKVRVHVNVVPRSTRDTNSGPRSSVGRVTEDLIRRSWVRFPPRSKDFSLPRVVPCFPLPGLTPSELFMGFSSTIIYTSELILCSTICVPSATRHNIYIFFVSCKGKVCYRDFAIGQVGFGSCSIL